VEAAPPPPEGAAETAAPHFDGLAGEDAAGTPIVGRVDDDTRGRLPWIALAVLLLVSVNGARQTLAARGRLPAERTNRRERPAPVGDELRGAGPAADPTVAAAAEAAEDRLALARTDLEEPGAAEEGASGGPTSIS
jgi:hypothetical protein